MGNKFRRIFNFEPNGFTLVEALIGIAISGIVIGAIYGIFFSANQSYFTQDSVTDTQQRARIGLDFMVRDIRMTGLNPMGTAIVGPAIEAARADKIRFTADKNMNGVIENVNRERLTYEFAGNRLYLYEGVDLVTPPPLDILIDNVSALSFTYRDVNGAIIALDPGLVPPAVPPANLPNIRTVDISITCQGKDYKRKDITRTLQSRINCRNLGM